MAETPHVIALRNDLAEIPRLAGALEAFAERHGLPAGTSFALNLALEELVTNTISYGYDEDDGRGHDILISLDMAGEEVVVRVEDDGRAYDPLARETPDLEAAVEDRQIGGLGVHLVRTLMDDVRYERVNGRNVLSMRKRVTDGESLL